MFKKGLFKNRRTGISLYWLNMLIYFDVIGIARVKEENKYYESDNRRINGVE